MSKYPHHQWKLAYRRTISAELRALTREQRRGVFDTLRKLLESENPYGLPGVKKLEGEFAPARRVRSGDHRIIFEVEASEKHPGFKGELFVHQIIARKDAY